MKLSINAATIILLWVSMLYAEKVVADLFPLAIGNSWTFALRTGGTQQYVIASAKKDSLLCISMMNSNGFMYQDTFSVYSFDSLGHFNFPLFRDLSKHLWGPHCGIAKDGPLTTSAGTFPETFLYPISWGHPCGGNRSAFLSPGVGPVALAWTTDLCLKLPCVGLDTFAFLQACQIVPKPQAVWHDTASSPNGLCAFSFLYDKGDSGQVTFSLPHGSCNRYMVTSSFNDATGVLRIYFVDTTGISCPASMTAYHTVKLRNLKQDSSYTIAIFSAYFDTSVNIYLDKKYPLRTVRNYFERIVCSSTSVAPSRSRIPKEAQRAFGVFDCTGRLLSKTPYVFLSRRPSAALHQNKGICIVKNDRGTAVVPFITKEK